jgi:hypothetical protein
MKQRTKFSFKLSLESIKMSSVLGTCEKHAFLITMTMLEEILLKNYVILICYLKSTCFSHGNERMTFL